jgi:alkyl hydroperoxide reductase subunit AhpC
MVGVGLIAPVFAGNTIQDGRLVPLRWRARHRCKTTLVSFDPIPGPDHLPDYLVAVSNAVARRSGPDVGVAVVWRNSARHTLAWATRRPALGGPGPLAIDLIPDPAGRIAACFDLVHADGRPLWGQFLIDRAGILRQAVVSGAPALAGVDELLRLIDAVEHPSEQET